MDDQAGLRRKDTTKGPPLRILSLDGGGVRGYSMFIIIQELMHRTFVEIHGRAPKREEIPKPCDHFDLIVGTGTGGLVAIMLGRLRLDLDTCKEVYVRMTRRVFETDKMVLGLPLKGTMFKATKLEESIRDCVREHTVFEDEGNDSLANAVPMTPNSAFSSNTPTSPRGPQRSMSQGSRYSQIGQSSAFNRFSFSSSRFGNPNALLYDTRENRTKTAVTAVLKGTSVNTLLRSYDSRKETAPDDNCMIWQAGRATAATQMAFKPIQIGQSIYLDEGAGRFNPSPQVLDEAVQNEWPGREVGVFISVGTGKRPQSSAHNQQEWWEGFLGGGMGDFAEARRKMIAKLEACEDIHRFMLREHLTTRGVPLDNYFRLNVEVGVGEFGMNEWNRLADISTNTRMYLSKNEVQAYTASAAHKLAKVHLAKLRYERSEARRNAGTDEAPSSPAPWQTGSRDSRVPSMPNAIELPGDDSYQYAPRYDNRYNVEDEKFLVVDEYDHPGYGQNAPYRPAPQVQPARQQHEFSNSRLSTPSYQEPGSRVSQEVPPAPASPPPLPPKTPMSSGGLPYPDREAPTTPEATTPQTFMNMGDLARRLPYPDVQGPPPPVNTANKPQISK